MELRHAIEQRRSINFFDPDRVIDTDTINKVLELAALAPSTMNMQPWKTVTVVSPEKKKLLQQVANNQPKVSEASAVFILLANTDFPEENAETVVSDMARLGYIPDDSVDGMVKKASAAHSDPKSEARARHAIISTALFGMNLMYACAAYGIQTHPMGGFSHEMLKKEFDLPGNRIPVMLVAAGYLKPGVELKPRVKRLSTESFNHIL